MTTNRTLPAMTLTDHLDPQLGDVHKSPPRLFDVCYLVDSVPDSDMSFRDPTHSIYPSIANAIRVMVDDFSGSKYSEWVSVNLAQEYAARAGEPLYSAFGTFAYISPFSLLSKSLFPSIESDRSGSIA